MFEKLEEKLNMLNRDTEDVRKRSKSKLLEIEENTGRTFFDINHSNIFLDPSPRVMETKAKINKWNLIKLKSFYTAKETRNKMKRQLTEWEKIFANDTTNKRLPSKIYKQLTQLNI